MMVRIPVLNAFMVLVLMSWGLAASATHIVGGEISYEDLGDGMYRVRLVVYRDCGPANQNGTGFDNAASVGIFNASGQLIDNLSIPLSFQNVNEVPVFLENPCGTPPPSVCVEQAVYEQVVEIGQSPNGFTLSYQRCCRNPSIINLNSPDDAGATFTTQIREPTRRKHPTAVRSSIACRLLPSVRGSTSFLTTVPPMQTGTAWPIRSALPCLGVRPISRRPIRQTVRLTPM